MYTNLDEIIFPWSFDTDEIHAVLSTSGLSRPPLQLLTSRGCIFPGKQIVVGHSSRVSPSHGVSPCKFPVKKVKYKYFSFENKI